MTATTDLQLVETGSAFTDTSDVDFGAGTLNSVLINDNGLNANIQLPKSELTGFTGSGGNTIIGIAYDPNTNSIWVPDTNNQKIIQLSAIDGTIIASYDSENFFIRDITYDSSTNSIWYTYMNATTGNVKKMSVVDGTITGTYPISNAYGVEFDSTTNSIWVTTAANGTIKKLRASDGVELGTYSAGTYPMYIAHDSVNNVIWVTDSSAHNVMKFDVNDGSLDATYPTGNTNAHYDIEYDSSTNSIWIGTSGLGIIKMSAVDGSVYGTYATNCNGAYYLSYDSSTNSIWSSCQYSDNIIQTSVADGSITGTYKIGEEPSVNIFIPTYNYIWTTNNFGQSISRIDVADGSDQFTSIDPFPSFTTNQVLPYEVVYEPITNSIWITSAMYGAGKISKINPNTGAVLGEYSTGSGTQGIVYDSSTSSLWIGNYYDNNIQKISPTDGSILGTYDVGSRPNKLAFDSSTNSIWVTLYDIDSVVKVSTTDGSILGTYSVGNGPKGITFDSSTNSIWVANSYDSNIEKIRASDGVSLGTFPSSSAFDIAFDSSTNSIWVARQNGPIEKFSTDGTKLGTISRTNDSLYIIFDSITNSIWSTSNTGYTMTKIRASDATILGTFSINDGPRGLAFEPITNSIWIAASTSDTLVKMPIYSYSSSGSLTSQIFNTTNNSSFGTTSWNDITSGNTSVNIKVRSDSNIDMSGATDWSSCTSITNGGDISSNSCITDQDQYIQYQASLSTSTADETPQFQDITINYNQYPSSQTLTSSAYNSSEASNVVSSMQWTENLATNTDIKFQIRTAPDNSDSPGTWTSWLGPTGTGDYYTDPTGSETINSLHTDGSNDQWMQYKTWLESSTNENTPTLSDASLVYVVNAPPEFEINPTATQNSDGTVTINYSIRDIDTTSGSSTPNNITPSFDYSIDGGNNWNSINTGLSSGATNNKTVEEVNYNQYQVVWTAKDQIDGTYSTLTQIRVNINDNEPANNIVNASSSNFTLDVKDPALGTNPISIDASASPANLTMSATDDSVLQMKISLNSDLSGASWQSYNTSSTIPIATNPDTVYIQYQDALSNNTTIQSVVSPETPENIIIRDISNPDTNDWQLFISWGSTSTPLVDFAFYRIWRSTDGTNYTLLDSINDRSRNYYLHSGLTQDIDNYYKITTERNDGSISYYSTIVSDAPDGQGGSDSTSPTISNVIASGISTQSAIITWDTDELSDSTTGFSTSPSIFNTEVGSPEMVDNDENYGPHSITLTGLIPGTKYYYRVMSQDPSYNSTTNNNGGDGFTFTTLSGPAISNVTPSSISNTKATITWLTDIASASSVYYSINSDLSDATEVTIDIAIKEHEVTVTELTPGTRYYFYVQSGVATDTNAGDYYIFNTTLDSTSPVITSVEAALTTDTKAVIQWKTNEKATSQASYGITSGTYTETTTLNSSLNTTHFQTINNLSPETTYYFIVDSIDESNNSSTSTEYSFTTLEELSEESSVKTREDLAREEGRAEIDTITPILTNIVISNITGISANISWDSDEDTNSFVQFGPTTEYGDIYGNWIYSKSHSVNIDNLVPTSLYHYRVISVDKAGNINLSDDNTFTTTSATDEASLSQLISTNLNLIETLSSEATIEVLESSLNEQYNLIDELSKNIPTPLISGEPRVDATATSAVISWGTDKEADSLIAIATEDEFDLNLDNPYSQIIGDSENYTTTHSVTLTNLYPNTIYHYQIRSKTPISQSTLTKDFTFQTDQKAFGIENYSIERINDQKVIFSWTTNVESSSAVQFIPYRNNIKSVDEAVVITDDIITNIHQVTINLFEAGIIYDITLSSAEKNGNTVTKHINAFTTNAENTPPIISQIQTDSALSPGGKAKVQTIISWRTNEPATSQIYFQQGVGEIDTEVSENTQIDKNYTKDHVVIITTFESGSVYQFQVESTDSSGLSSLSTPITILTPQEEQTVFEVIFSAMEDAFGWLRVFNK